MTLVVTGDGRSKPHSVFRWHLGPVRILFELRQPTFPYVRSLGGSSPSRVVLGHVGNHPDQEHADGGVAHTFHGDLLNSNEAHPRSQIMPLKHLIVSGFDLPFET
jgi:hypothetical protein